MVSQVCPCRITPDNLTESGVSNLAGSLAEDQVRIAYSDCCQPLHQGVKIADSSEALMRSRYSAFVKVLPDYIIETTVPAQQSLLDRQAIKEWAEQTNWAGLQIINHNPKVSKRHAQVEFKAYYHDDQLGSPRLSAHHELSTFVKIAPHNSQTQQQNSKTVWYFLDPTTALNMTQKQPCICGSGEKFKRCCGQFL